MQEHGAVGTYQDGLGDVHVYDDLAAVPLDGWYDWQWDGNDSLLRPYQGVALPSAPVTAAPEALLAQPRRLVVPYGRELRYRARGQDVIGLKRAVSRWDARVYPWHPAKYTPVFGQVLRRAVRNFQQRNGLHVDGVYGPATHRKLAPHYDATAAHLLALYPHQNPAAQQRAAIVAAALFGYNHRWQIHYTQGAFRMYGVRHHTHPPGNPYYEDCSSFATWCYYVAGLPDPNHLRYAGIGYTGTLAQHGTRVLSGLRAGDLPLYGRAPYKHVTVMITDTMCVSHGSEAGPVLTRVAYRPDYAHAQRYVGV